MSMLTPPGMGGQYRIKGDKYPRMRRSRRRRIVLVSVASLAALGLLGWGTVQLVDVFSGDDGSKTVAAKAPDCKPGKPSASATPPKTPDPKTLPAPAKIKVNVLNATPRSGLAKTTADELKKRGFKIGEVGNATKEYDKKVKGAGLLLGPPSATEGALVVLGTQLSGAETKAVARDGDEVDLVIGTAFKKLSPKAEADKALAALTKPAPEATKNRC
ncbi:LytR family transcriptional regulator [Streptomyces triticagri]|uniref:LytR family transcriptional regulator n=1 Tax=Streptomyces triticagri TaxID=2293568 RepID=A0A372M938_9ACTN|nr:LytR C-terminal domain-containing protein [Streptomyces triticagri]RFU87349.1 LytR family transcriptional regulator [Streptomyces triticagri]